MKKIIYCHVYFFICLFFLTFGCKTSSTDTTDNTVEPVANPNFQTHIQSIFTSSCALSGCHNAGSARGGLILVSGQSYGNLVNVDATNEPNRKRVLPNDADNSYLIIKLEGRQTVGSRMPPSGALAGNQIQTIKNWINLGASND